MISGVHGCLLWFVAAGGALAEADALVRLEGSLAQALEANERLAALVERQREEIARLGEELAARDGELGRVNAELVVLKRMLFGRSSERARPSPADGGADGGDEGRPAGGGNSGKRGPGARAGRRDYWLFNFGRAPSVSSLTIGGSAGCSATVPGAGSSPGSGTRRRRVSPA